VAHAIAKSCRLGAKQHCVGLLVLFAADFLVADATAGDAGDMF